MPMISKIFDDIFGSNLKGRWQPKTEILAGLAAAASQAPGVQSSLQEGLWAAAAAYAVASVLLGVLAGVWRRISSAPLNAH